MVSVGIDIGTSNTVVAVTNTNGEPQIRTISNEALMPSVIYVDETAGARTVGREAIEEWANPEYDQAGSFRRWKLQMGQGVELRQMRFGGKTSNITSITPELLTTWLVEHVLTELSAGIGGETIDSVLVTVPHGWRRESPEKCRATRQAAGAAQLAGEKVEIQPVTLSEPVAAAVYWLWAARKNPQHQAEDFVGKTVLVCDIGGGTFDLSLVQVAPPGQPLLVVDAINHNFAGDYVTSLIMARAVQVFNEEHGTHLSESADEILAQVAGAAEAWMRSWFITAQEMQKSLSLKIAAAARRGRTATIGVDEVFRDLDGRTVQLRLSPDEFMSMLDPFYEHGRDLVRQFLEMQTDETRPYAVVFAGGGSRIAGVADQIMRPSLEKFVTNAEEVLTRITINDNMVDQAIALGAALVANGVVSVQERLLCDVGIESAVDANLGRILGLPAGEETILLTPVLARGTELPARFQASEQSLPPWAVAAGKTMEIRVVIDDDPTDPWVQSWEVPHPADGRTETLDILVQADSDGVLSLTFIPIQGRSTTLQGQLSRTGRASLVFRSPGEPLGVGKYRVTLTQMQGALRTARRKA